MYDDWMNSLNAKHTSRTVRAKERKKERKIRPERIGEK
jgi:hypothetical protein